MKVIVDGRYGIFRSRLAHFFGARAVTFRAGMELDIMNSALAVISWLRAHIGFAVLSWINSVLMWIAKRLLPFGTDICGKSVAVTCQSGTAWMRKTWRLVATAGEGPYILALASRVVLRNINGIQAGARPALA